MVISCINQCFLIIVFVFLNAEKPNITPKKLKKSKVHFEEVKFSEDGINLSNIETERIIEDCLLAINIIKVKIKKIFFSINYSEIALNNLIIVAQYILNWTVTIEKIRLLINTFEIWNIQIENNRNAYLKITKMSKLGEKITGSNLELGYNEPLGWVFKSGIITYDGLTACLVSNKIGFNKAKIVAPNMSISIKPGSGFIGGPIFSKDLNDNRYLSLKYYILGQKKTCDLMIQPMFYLKDLGINITFRDLAHNVKISYYGERLYSCFFKQQSNLKINRNDVIKIESNNKNIDANFILFNGRCNNEIIWKKMNYQNFQLISKDYWGYIYLTFDRLKLSILENNSKRIYRYGFEITKWLKIEGEKNGKEKDETNIVLSKKFFYDIDLFLIDIGNEFKFKVIEDAEFRKYSKNDLNYKFNCAIDLPMFCFSQNIIRASLKFENKCIFFDGIKASIKKTGLQKDLKLHGKIENKIGGEIHFMSSGFQIKATYNDKQNYGIIFMSQVEYLDSIYVENKSDKIFVGCTFLDGQICYGLKISSTQLLTEVLFTASNYIKLKLIGSYSYKKYFFDRDNINDKETFFAFGIEFMTNAWKININIGLENIEKSGKAYVYGISLSPREWLSFAELEKILKDIQVEQKKILALYDEFK